MSATTSTRVVRVPEDTHNEATQVAALRQVQAGELLADAWREYMENHREEFAKDLEEDGEATARRDAREAGGVHEPQRGRSRGEGGGAVELEACRKRRERASRRGGASALVVVPISGSRSGARFSMESSWIVPIRSSAVPLRAPTSARTGSCA